MKLRTNKTVAKRFRRNGKGVIQQTTLSSQHLRHNKTHAVLARSKRYATTAKVNIQRIAKLIPYAK